MDFNNSTYDKKGNRRLKCCDHSPPCESSYNCGKKNRELNEQWRGHECKACGRKGADVKNCDISCRT